MRNVLRKSIDFFKSLGPGLITGASDDDPSGIATYSIAGAQYGYQMNFLSLWLLPGMVAVQEMAARLGLITGKGLSRIVRDRWGTKIATVAVFLFLIATILNIGADLAVMAEVTSGLIHVPWVWGLVGFSIIIISLEIFIPYRIYARVLLGLSAFLLVYPITAFLTPQPWGIIVKQLVIPTFTFTPQFFMTMIGFVGTTISPFMFFWQTSEEVEEEILKGETHDFNRRPHMRKHDISAMRRDTWLGMLFSNVITFFLILTTASALWSHGINSVATAQEAALALKPFAGDRAYLLFSLGIIGIGLQAVPVMAGAIGYAIAELFNKSEGLGKSFRKATWFYIAIILATVSGALLMLCGIKPMNALYLSAVVNGVLAVPLLILIIKLANDKHIVGENKTPLFLYIAGILTTIFMAISVGIMIWQSFFQ